MKAVLYVVEILIIIAMVLVANYLWPVSADAAGEARAVLIELGEVALYFMAALCLFYVARYFNHKAGLALETQRYQEHLRLNQQRHDAAYWSHKGE